MPGPPPPPMAPNMPPPPAFTPLSKGGPDDRSALLKSIQKGAKLKKTVTNDKSAPIIPGKISNNNNNTSLSSHSGGGGGGGFPTSPTPTPNGLNLGGLFAGGMPKLRPTGKLAYNSNSSLNAVASSNSDISNSSSARRKPELPPQPAKSLTSVQSELKKQMASDNKNRGPPPPAPVRNFSEEYNPKPTTPPAKNLTLNGFRVNQSSLHLNANIQSNNSTLHRKAKSNVNLNNIDVTDSSLNGVNQSNKPVINHGKPHLAPKPPILNGKPNTPPKKLIMNGKSVSRAHSMKSPRSPSPQSPIEANAAMKFGTVRNLSSVIGQSLGNHINHNPRSRPALNGRPTAPPPSVPSQQPPPPPSIPMQPPPPSPHNSAPPPPPFKTGIVRPPNHAPPPPPGTLPQPPSHAPPLPPHRTQPTPMRAPPAVPTNLSAPPPPPRHSSMRETSAGRKHTVDFDDRFHHLFRSMNTFPKPPPYRNTLKLYSHRQAGNKQQAPQPPTIQTTTNKTWDATSTC